jgi:hypothetical protein
MISKLYVKQYTYQEWQRFSWEIQEKLCQKYNVFLINKKNGKITPAKQSFRAFIQQDKKSIAIQIAKNINKKNLDKGLVLIRKGTNQVSRMANGIGKFSTDLDKFLDSKSGKKRRVKL